MFQISAIFKETISNGLFFDELIHGIVAIPFAIYIWRQTKSIKNISVLYLVVYLIDLDHLFDYWLFLREISFNLLPFFELDFFDIKKTAYIPFHAWEFLIPLFLLGRKKKLQSVFTIIALGLLAHLFWDIFTMKSVLFYSLIYRFSHHFFLPK